MDDVELYRSTIARLEALIDPVGPADRSLAAVWARAEEKLARARAFLAYLGDPQDSFPIVHVTGTSGKGSTCTAIAAMLTQAGYRTGLATSPFLQVATEKLQINDQLIATAEFAALVNDVLNAAERWRVRASLDRPLTYGEIWVAVTATWFAQRQVDIAVLEVGAGGRFDVTNVVRPLVAVVTTVGLDHTATLGPTIEHIAWHKGGIFKPGAAAITAATHPAAVAALRQEATALGLSLTVVDPDRALAFVESGRSGTRWQPVDELGQPRPAVYWSRQPGRHQAVNGAVALAVIDALADRGFQVSVQARQDGLAQARMPGRGELMPTLVADPDVLIDAAHNPDKMLALVTALPLLLGSENGAPIRPVLLTGALAGKDARTMIRHLHQHVSAVVTTSAGVTGKDPQAAADIAEVVGETGFAGPIVAQSDPHVALMAAMQAAREFSVPVLVTGSLFLAGRARGHWYRAEDILRQQTPWPVVVAAPR